MFTKKRLLGITLIVVLILVLVQPAFSQTNIVDLGTLGCCGSSAASINDLSQVVGTSGTPGGFVHAFLWSAKTGMQDLGTLGGNYSSASSINDRGQVVGVSSYAGDERHAFLWAAKGGMQDLGTLGGSYSAAHAINAQGQVVGESETAAGAFQHAFSWSAQTGMQDLGTLGGPYSIANAINDHGQIAGSGIYKYEDESERKFLAVRLDPIPPKLAIQCATTNVLVSWTPNWPGVVLEATPV